MDSGSRRGCRRSRFPKTGLALRIILFNVGIELGQLAVLFVVVGLWKLLSHVLIRPAVAERVAFGAMIAAGLIAAVVLPFTASTDAAMATQGTCTESDYSPPAPTGGSHPPKRFFGPTEAAPSEDMGHVLYDGWVVITYKASLPTSRRVALKTWVEGKDQAVVAAASADQPEAIRAFTVRSSLVCSDLELDTLQRFRDAWFDSR